MLTCLNLCLCEKIYENDKGVSWGTICGGRLCNSASPLFSTTTIHHCHQPRLKAEVYKNIFWQKWLRWPPFGFSLKDIYVSGVFVFVLADMIPMAIATVSILIKDISMALVHLSLSLPEIAEWLNSLSKTPMALVLTVQHFLLPLDLQKDLNFFQFPKLSKHKKTEWKFEFMKDTKHLIILRLHKNETSQSSWAWHSPWGNL